MPSQKGATRSDDSWITNKMEGKVIAEVEHPQKMEIDAIVQTTSSASGSATDASAAEQQALLAERLKAQKEIVRMQEMNSFVKSVVDDAAGPTTAPPAPPPCPTPSKRSASSCSRSSTSSSASSSTRPRGRSSRRSNRRPARGRSPDSPPSRSRKGRAQPPMRRRQRAKVFTVDFVRAIDQVDFDPERLFNDFKLFKTTKSASGVLHPHEGQVLQEARRGCASQPPHLRVRSGCLHQGAAAEGATACGYGDPEAQSKAAPDAGAETPPDCPLGPRTEWRSPAALLDRSHRVGDAADAILSVGTYSTEGCPSAQGTASSSAGQAQGGPDDHQRRR